MRRGIVLTETYESLCDGHHGDHSHVLKWQPACLQIFKPFFLFFISCSLLL